MSLPLCRLKGERLWTPQESADEVCQEKGDAIQILQGRLFFAAPGERVHEKMASGLPSTFKSTISDLLAVISRRG